MATHSTPHRIIRAANVRAIGRFNPGGPTGYQSVSAADAPVRATRAEAMVDEVAHWAAVDTASAESAS